MPVQGTPARLQDYIRGLFKLGLGLANDQIIPKHAKGPREKLPYLTVKVTLYDQEQSSPIVDWKEVDGEVQETESVLCTAFILVEGYGDLTPVWLESVKGMLRRDDVCAFSEEEGIEVVDLTPVTDITLFLDTGYETRHARTFEVRYHRTTIVGTYPICETIGVEIELHSTTLAPTITIAASPLTKDCS